MGVDWELPSIDSDLVKDDSYEPGDGELDVDSYLPVGKNSRNADNICCSEALEDSAFEGFENDKMLVRNLSF